MKIELTEDEVRFLKAMLEVSIDQIRQMPYAEAVEVLPALLSILSKVAPAGRG